MSAINDLHLTKEQAAKYYKNYKIAAEYYHLLNGEVLHHINSYWRHNDIERYIMWNIFDLVKLTNSEHMRLHMLENNPMNNEESRKKISNANKGKCHPHTEQQKKNQSIRMYGENNPMFGKHHSEESKEKMKVTKGKHRVYTEDGIFHYE